MSFLGNYCVTFYILRRTNRQPINSLKLCSGPYSMIALQLPKNHSGLNSPLVPMSTWSIYIYVTVGSFVKFMWQLSPDFRTREAVDDCLVSVPRCRAHTVGAHAVLVLFLHFRRYTRRLRTCRRSLSLSQTGRAVRGGCALLLPDV